MNSNVIPQRINRDTIPSSLDRFTRRWIVRLLLLLFAVAPAFYLPWAAGASTTSAGWAAHQFGIVLFGFPLTGVILSVPILIAGLFFRRTRQSAIVLILFGAVFVPCTVAGNSAGNRRRIEAFRDFPEHSRPLVKAITSYETDRGRPPATLNDLVPQYIAAVPSTGMSAYPEYRYRTGAEAEWYAGNPWVLSVSTYRAFGNWDEFLYFPRQNYDDYRFSNALEPVGDWVYHHE
jgi:hypothetical protein